MPVMTASSLFFGKASIGLRRSRGAGAHRRALLRPLAMRVPTPLPGEWSGPGSGHRHFPEDHEEEQADATARTSFDCKTTAQCYEVRWVAARRHPSSPGGGDIYGPAMQPANWTALNCENSAIVLPAHGDLYGVAELGRFSLNNP